MQNWQIWGFLWYKTSHLGQFWIINLMSAGSQNIKSSISSSHELLGTVYGTPWLDFLYPSFLPSILQKNS